VSCNLHCYTTSTLAFMRLPSCAAPLIEKDGGIRCIDLFFGLGRYSPIIRQVERSRWARIDGINVIPEQATLLECPSS
jgi:hypothetical protein